MGGDEFKKRFLVFHRLIYRIAFGVSGEKAEAEDITQAVYEKLWRRRDSLHAVENDEAYIVSLSKNTAIDYLRRNSRCFSVPLDGERDIGSQDSAEARLEGKETLNAIEQCMKTLSTTQQEAFRLRHFDDLSIAQIAETMRQSEVNVRQLLSRARRSIKEQIQRIGISVY
ncbi:MAG: sigma-70 family RNA polymerase sigma factor [Dysgonamonadaceae bacterium]|jgi:RNA polymerase sigma-70 factor (ECF subfamily)|nr:sigma-70 family RNA polymerase sigma factor [Dysgonamonadaceae bacterium]